MECVFKKQVRSIDGTDLPAECGLTGQECPYGAESGECETARAFSQSGNSDGK